MKEKQSWNRLDNASNIFLATRNDIDTKVFRFSVQMNDEVDPTLLQQALNQVYQQYPLFHSMLRRGIFWYYLSENEQAPLIELEIEPPCAPLYESGKENVLFRVLYNTHQIHLEVFHALTDGTGALWFFEDLLSEYADLIDAQSNIKVRHKDDLEDSFKHYFRGETNQSIFDQLLKPLKGIYQKIKPFEILKSTQKPFKKTYQIKGTYTPDHRPRLVKCEMSSKQVLEISRKYGVSLTIYLSALFIISAYETKKKKNKKTTISISIPINLRQLFPSATVRNFFSTTIVSYTFLAHQEVDIEDVCQTLNKQFNLQLEKDAIEKRVSRLVAFEFHPLGRVILRVVKDFVLKIVNKINNRRISLAMSNLGVIKLPQNVQSQVSNIYFYTSVIRPQFCVNSYQDKLTIVFSSPYIEVDIFKHFIQILGSQDVSISVDVNKVSEQELSKS